MKKKQLQQFEMLVRVSEFGAARREAFPDSSVAGQAFAAVAEAAGKLRGHAMAQMTLRQEGARGRAAARAELEEMMESISRTARAIQAAQPGFPNTFHLPVRKSAQTWLTAGGIFARDIEPLAKVFIDRAMPATFVADFKRVLAAYEQAVRRREDGKGETAAARAGIEETMEQALAAVRELDAIVRNQMRGEATAIAKWERVLKVPAVRRETEPDAAVIPGPEPEPAPSPGPAPVAPVSGATTTPPVATTPPVTSTTPAASTPPAVSTPPDTPAPPKPDVEAA